MGLDVQLLKNNSKIFKNNIARFVRTTNKKGITPPMISFLVTNRCNLSCKHCFYNTQNDALPISKKELTFDEYKLISNSMGKFIKAIFSGGEPFLREDFSEIIYLFQKNNIMGETSSSTNGQAMDNVIYHLERILKHNKNSHFSLAFSLDGFEEYHDEIRGKHTFSNSIKTWKECKKLFHNYNNFEMYICTTINTLNEMIMPKFISWCINELNPSMVSMLKIRQHPRAGDFLKGINIDNYYHSMKIIKSAIEEGAMGDINKPQTYITSSICEYVYKTLINKKRNFQCFAGTYGAFVDYNGNVGACEVVSPLGNLRDYNCNFKDLWNDPKLNEIRNLAGKQNCCLECTHETEGILPSIYFGENEIISIYNDESL